jgi:hypothetical protein
MLSLHFLSRKYDLRSPDHSLFNIESVLLHNDGFCNRYVTKRCMNNATNISYDDLLSKLLYDKM